MLLDLKNRIINLKKCQFIDFEEKELKIRIYFPNREAECIFENKESYDYVVRKININWLKKF